MAQALPQLPVLERMEAAVEKVRQRRTRAKDINSIPAIKPMKTNKIKINFKFQSGRFTCGTICALFWLLLLAPCWAQLPPAHPLLPAIDKRHDAAQAKVASAEQTQAASLLRELVPTLKVEFEPVSGSPKSVAATEGFLTGPAGA